MVVCPCYQIRHPTTQRNEWKAQMYISGKFNIVLMEVFSGLIKICVESIET
jgi:hypothetical protein